MACSVSGVSSILGPLTFTLTVSQVMEKLPAFIAHHWFLVACFVVAFILLIITEARSKGLGGGRVTPQQATILINRENAVVVDIRDANAFNAGHVVNAQNIPAAQLDQQMNRLEAFKQRSIILVCATGQKSLSVMATLKKRGFEKVFVLTGGMGAWKNASMPVVK